MRPPILWMAVGFGAGLWVGLDAVWSRGAGVWLVVAPLAAGAVVVARRAPVAAAMATTALAGVAWGGTALRARDASCAGRWAAAGARGTARTRAVVVRLGDAAPAGGGILSARVTGGSCGGVLRLRWPDRRPAAGGTAWIVAGRWFGSAARGALAVRRARPVGGPARGRGALRGRVAARSAALFGSRAPLVDALVLARRAELDPAARERFARAGLAHLLAISGLHVGFLAAWLGVVLRWLRLPRRARVAVSAVCVVAYVALLGFPPPATRAAAMLVLVQVAHVRQRAVAPRGLIALAALLVMVVDPWAVRAVGAWLSVAAVAAVVWAARATTAAPAWVRVLIPSLAATLATAPVSAFAFGTVAPIGVALNLVAIPLAGVTVPGLFLALLVDPVAPAVASLFAAGSGLGLALLDAVARFGAAIPGGHMVQVPGWTAAFQWAGIAGAAWWLWHAPRRPWVLGARTAAIAAGACWMLAGAALARDAPVGLAVYFLDVGQGDAAALRTPVGRWIVIDGGPRFGERDAGRAVVVPFLRRHGVQALTAVIASHGDADHLGGLPTVIETFPPAYVLEPGEPLGRSLYLEFLAAVEQSGAHWRAARAGDRLELDGVTLEVLSPDSSWLALPVDVNDHGIVLRVTYGAVRLLFQGDAGVSVEARLAGRVGPITLLKVGHHGSRTATSDAWLSELAPPEAVISVGRRNSYGHPAPEVLGRLAAHGVAVLRTDRDGDITFTTDGIRAYSHVDHD